MADQKWYVPIAEPNRVYVVGGGSELISEASNSELASRISSLPELERENGKFREALLRISKLRGTTSQTIAKAALAAR